jgi:hypothetical protein
VVDVAADADAWHPGVKKNWGRGKGEGVREEGVVVERASETEIRRIYIVDLASGCGSTAWLENADGPWYLEW